jgi:hypothetical protein
MASAQTSAVADDVCPQAKQHLEVPSQILIEGKPPQVAFLFSDSGIDVYMIIETQNEVKATPPIKIAGHLPVGKQSEFPQPTVDVTPSNAAMPIVIEKTPSLKERGIRYSGDALWVYQDETARREAVKSMLEGNPPLGFNTSLFYSKLKFVVFHFQRLAGNTEVFGSGAYFEPAECGPAYPYGLVSEGPNLKFRETNMIGWDVDTDIPRDGSKRAMGDTGLLLYRTERAMEAKEKWKEQVK